VYAVANLHAKVFVFSRRAIVASANLSSSSRDALLEAGVELSEPTAVAACRRFVNGLRADEVGAAFATSLQGKYRPPPMAKRRRFRRRGQVETIQFDEVDERAERSARAVGQRRLSDPNGFRLETIRWSSTPPKNLKPGIRLLQLLRTPQRTVVYAPCRVLAIRKYTSTRGTHRAMICVEVRKRLRTRTIGELTRRLGSSARVFRKRRVFHVLRDSQLVLRLGRVWAISDP
jgi:hypothetical protein